MFEGRDCLLHIYASPHVGLSHKHKHLDLTLLKGTFLLNSVTLQAFLKVKILFVVFVMSKER